MEMFPKPLNVKDRPLLNNLGRFLGIRLQWKMYIPPHTAEPIKTVALIGSAPQVQSAILILSLYIEGDIDREPLAAYLGDVHDDMIILPRVAMAYRRRMKEIDTFILHSVKLQERKIHGVTDRILLAKAPKTKFKENTLIL
jgi:hypothetical protein